MVIAIVFIFSGKYWPKVADERKKKPYSITLADKNAPNEEVWRQVMNVQFLHYTAVSINEEWQLMYH